MKSPHVSIVIPTLNEEQNIGSLLGQVSSMLKGYAYEIIVVDGHSADKTVEHSKVDGREG